MSLERHISYEIGKYLSLDSSLLNYLAYYLCTWIETQKPSRFIFIQNIYMEKFFDNQMFTHWSKGM
jgi:hypothetical protein